MRRCLGRPARPRRHPAVPAALPLCAACGARFDDLTGTVLAGHHQPLRVWVLCLYVMGLNLSNRQIAMELGLNASDGQAMAEQLRHGLVASTPAVQLEGEVESDEVYVVAGRKGQPAAVAKGGGSGAVASWQGQCRKFRVWVGRLILFRPWLG